MRLFVLAALVAYCSLATSFCLANADELSPTLSACDRQKYERSILECNQQIKKVPQEATAYCDRSSTYFHLGRYKEALNDANTAVKLDSQDEIAYCNRGEALIGLKQYKSAIADFDNVLKLDPELGEAYYYRSLAYKKLGQTQLAASDYKHSQQLAYVPGQDIDYSDFMSDVQQRIKRVWFPPKGEVTKRITVVFNIKRDGEAIKLKLVKPADTEAANQAALAAVKEASPFRPLPMGSPREATILFTFDYNVFGNKIPGSFKQY